MKQIQYTIEQLDSKLQAQWEDLTILFDSQEEAEEMISLFPSSLNNVKIKSGIYFIDGSINYKDLKLRDDFQEEINAEKDNKSKAPLTLQEALDTILSPDNMSNFTPNELADFLVENKIVKTITDVNKIVIEGIQKALEEDDEFPIRYYSKEEDISEHGKIVENPGEMLTDTLVKQMKGVNG